AQGPTNKITFKSTINPLTIFFIYIPPLLSIYVANVIIQQKNPFFPAEFSILSIIKKNNEIHNLIFFKKIRISK
ncbi:hypothetical protein KQJ29_27535, partial [Enterococcus sp. S181_ASV_20]|nr:hypothetical protein [Enterococcus sp. S181_ASV_20]